jgi:PST family polysaccharide transporter
MRITVLATFASGAIQVIALAVLARLLHPAQFGVVAAVLVIVKPVQQILFNGVEQAAVLQSELDERATTSLFWLSLAIAAVGVAVIVGLAALLPIAPGPRAAAVGLSLIVLGPALGLAPRVMLRRDLAFGRLAVAEIAATVIGFGVVAIAAALAGFGALSLVLGYVGQTLLRALVSLALCPRAVRGWRLDWRAVRPTLAMAMAITRISLLEIVHAQIAPGFVGADLGAAALGKFSQATSIVVMPGQLIAMSMTRVASTPFRIARVDPVQLRASCRSLVETASAITLPICVAIAAAAGPLVQVLLGPQWNGVAQILPWLTAGAAAGVLGHLLAVLNEAAGKLEEKFRIQLLASVVLAAALLVAAPRGLAPCAEAQSFATVLYLAAQTWLAGRTMAVRAMAMAGWIWPACLCSAAVCGCVLGIQALFASTSVYLRLGLDGVACAAVLTGLYAVFFPRLLRELLYLAGLVAAPSPEDGGASLTIALGLRRFPAETG